MKGFVEHIISECDRLEKELERDFDRRHSVLSYQELLALQLAGVKDKDILACVGSGTQDSLKGCLTSSNLDMAHQILERQRGLGIESISFLDQLSYPGRLANLGDSRPVFLHCLGDMDLLNREKFVAIIGSRNASSVGQLMAYDLGLLYGGIEEDRDRWRKNSGCPGFVNFRYSEKSPYVIVSGLEAGCEVAAHEGCLSVNGDTLAVAVAGLDGVYPSGNTTLLKRIVENGGLVISERVIGAETGSDLALGNRIQAALADIVIVAECSKRSGTLKTVFQAGKLNRKVLAVEYGWSEESNSGNTVLLKRKRAEPIDYPF